MVRTRGPIPTQYAHVDSASPDDLEVGIRSQIWIQLKMMWNVVSTNAMQFMVDSGLYEFANRLIRKGIQHPFITLIVAVAVLAVGLPLLLITIFVLATVMLTFSGFVLVEGTLISISSILLFGCLGAMLIVFLFFTGATLASYFGFLHIYDLYQGLHDKTAITNFLRREKRNES